MKSAEEFLLDLARRQNSSSAAFPFHDSSHRATLPDDVRQAANRGWQIFPVSQLAKLKANPDLLIDEATSDVSRLEELAAEYPMCVWRVAVGLSALCIFELTGTQGRDSIAGLGQELEECLTLEAERGNTTCSFFRWPKGLVLRNWKLAGVRILGPGDSCVIPPSGTSVYRNPWAEVEAVPYWLRELAFETPDSPPANRMPVPASSPRPAPCRSRVPFENPRRGARTGHPVCGQAGWRGGYRISRRR